MPSSPSQRPAVNRQFVLASRPTGIPVESNFRLVENPIPELRDGEFLARAVYLSVDPYMRGRISGLRSYAAPVEVGGPIVGGGVARVIETRNPGFAVGDYIDIYMGWQEYAISTGQGLRKLDPAAAPVSTALGLLGMPGMTAYFCLVDLCDPKPGETVVVSGAAGAVGSAAGQIARIKGCRVVGTAGSDDKVDYIVRECGFDAGLNYKTTTDCAAKLRELCPNGVDAYFDNVGGPITDAVFEILNLRARVAICGQISQYNNTKVEMGPRLLPRLIATRARVQGFLVTDYAARFGAARAEMTEWVRSGQLKYREDIVEGFENLPKAFIGLFHGENIGKRLVRVE
jgi:NADPH:quinone reductase